MAAKKTTNSTPAKLPIYVVSGKDRRRAADQVQQLIDLILADADPQVSLSSYEGANVQIADVLDELRTLPFLSPCRLVVVKEADPFITKYRSALEDYLESPSATGILLLMADSFPKTTKLAKKTAQIGKIVACDPIKPYQIPEFLTQYARDQHQLTLAKTTAQLLQELIGDEPGMLISEIDKLAVYLADPDKPTNKITPQAVNALVGQNRQYNVFNVIDAMTAGKTTVALTQLEKMFNQDRDAQYTVVGAFAWHFRRLYNARILLDQRVSPASVPKQVGVWLHPEQFIKQAQTLNLANIAIILRQLMNIDYQSKSGGMTAQFGIEQLILKFCTQPRTKTG
ncbi:MAG: DNA polymerase III subunit delta [Sedimentisphaerales bacterium]|nr:DNA polymerase III subunit delta [Sedimentisphaerales bacterium]